MSKNISNLRAAFTRNKLNKPKPDAEPDHAKQIARINEITRTAKASWFGLLSYMTFVGVTLLSVEDAEFFIRERETQLPLIGVAIPTFLFFVVAPMLGLTLFAYHHLHLIKLWEALGDAKSGNNGKHLSDDISPWLVSDYALSKRQGKALRSRPMNYIASGVTLLLVYLGMPIILSLMWWRSTAAHSELLTIFGCGVPLIVTIYVALVSQRYLKCCMRRNIDFPRKSRTASLGIIAALVFTVLGWFATEGTLDQYARDGFGFTSLTMSNEAINNAWWSGSPFPGLLASADLEGINFIDLPLDWRSYSLAQEKFYADWCETHLTNDQKCGPINFAEDDWFQERDFQLQSLISRNYGRLDLRKAKLFSAKLTNVNLNGVRLQGADLRGADLESAQLRGAHLIGANLENANLERANLESALMSGSNLQNAIVVQANLVRALVNDSNLLGADFSGSDLREVNANGSFLDRVSFDENTLLRNATFLYGAAQNGNWVKSPIMHYHLREMFGRNGLALPEKIRIENGSRYGEPRSLGVPAFGEGNFYESWRSWQVAKGYRTPAQGE